MSAQTHRSDPRILNQRTLAKDHRILAERLYPGAAVLDVGCGTGAITVGIAEAVGAAGRVVGVDRDASLVALAQEEHGSRLNLTFQVADAMDLPFEREFDIVTAARAVQWMSDPAAALAQMVLAVKPGGLVIVLDYNHDQTVWRPDPPPEFQRFFTALLRWREANRWDNAIGDRLAGLFTAAGLSDVQPHSQNESGNAEMWQYVMENLGPTIAAAGFLSESELAAAAELYGDFVQRELQFHELSLIAVEGVAGVRG